MKIFRHPNPWVRRSAVLLLFPLLAPFILLFAAAQGVVAEFVGLGGALRRAWG